ncbi:chain-length determining protein [Bacteroidia bacterium]|nr:chain-length determining protein [Bacteroidia bacterium]
MMDTNTNTDTNTGNNTDTASTKGTDEQEIDIIELIRRLWHNRKFLFKMMLIFMLIGIFVALFSAKQYTAGCLLLPQTAAKSMGGNLGGLAAMAGINLGNMGGSEEVLSPKMYSKILESVPFQKQLMRTNVSIKDVDESVTLLDYFTDKKYAKFNLLGFIAKYTIGLPGVIIGAIQGEPKQGTIDALPKASTIESLTLEERKCMGVLKQLIKLTVNAKDGYVDLQVSMSEPLAAAQFAESVQHLLQANITEFKIDKVQSTLNFVQSRYDETKQEFEKIQDQRAVFRDANKNLTSAKAQTEEEKLNTRYNLALAVYTDLARQLEQAKINVKETTPQLTVIDPVTVPFQASKPRKTLLVVAFTFVGVVIGVGLVFGLPFLAKLSGKEKIRKWVVD